MILFFVCSLVVLAGSFSRNSFLVNPANTLRAVSTQHAGITRRGAGAAKAKRPPSMHDSHRRADGSILLPQELPYDAGSDRLEFVSDTIREQPPLLTASDGDEEKEIDGGYEGDRSTDPSIVDPEEDIGRAQPSLAAGVGDTGRDHPPLLTAIDGDEENVIDGGYEGDRSTDPSIVDPEEDIIRAQPFFAEFNDGNSVSSEVTTRRRPDGRGPRFRLNNLPHATVSGEHAARFLSARLQPDFPGDALLSTGLDTIVSLRDHDGRDYTWRIDKRIGHGAFGVVYRATNLIVREASRSFTPYPKWVALKFTHHHQALSQLVAEANRLHKLRYARGVQRLVTVARYGQGGVMMASLYYPRGDLESYLTRHTTSPLSRAQMWQFATDAFLTLNAIHEHCTPPLIHGDIKPSNLFLDEDHKIIFGDWGGDGRIVTMTYSSAHRVPRPVFADDFTSLFLSIFQLDGTISLGTGYLNDINRRIIDPNTGQRAKNFAHLRRVASVWDQQLEQLMEHDADASSDARLRLWKNVCDPRGSRYTYPYIEYIFKTKCKVI